MPYVQRNEAGEIIGKYANPQEGYAEEFLPDDDAELQPTINDIAKQFEDAIQSHLDAEAQAKNYDNINTACSYAAAPNPFQLESLSFVTWRGNVWAYCYQELAKVQSGERSLPTLEQIISELPVRA